jgi:hypothetical protein
MRYIRFVYGAGAGFDTTDTDTTAITGFRYIPDSILGSEGGWRNFSSFFFFSFLLLPFSLV